MAAITRSPPSMAHTSLPDRSRWTEPSNDAPSSQAPTDTQAGSPRIKDAPLSPVRLSFHPDNWAQPSNASIEQGHNHSPHQAVIDGWPAEEAHAFPTGESEYLSSATVAQASHEDGIAKSRRNFSGPTRALDEDPYRQSRDTDMSKGSQQQGSAESSSGTNPSSVSQDPSESQTISDHTSQEGSSLDSGIPGNNSVPQLQYHHQAILPRVSSVPLEANAARQSTMLELADHGKAMNRHLTPNGFNRRSTMPRPQSSYSLYSDRGASPHMRVSSGQARRSPDNRPSSYAELLNAPYPQPEPAPIAFDNAYLRNNVGTNAALLSTQKTLEMYRQNLKKTNDLGIQYTFAVYLIRIADDLISAGHPYEVPGKKKSAKSGAESPSEDIAQSSPAALTRESKNILTKLSNAGYPFAQYYLADGYASGRFSKGKEDYNTALPLFVIAAKHGHAESAFRAGLSYQFGWGSRPDPVKARDYLRMAAAKSHPGAMAQLGHACLNGELGEVNYREGLKWLKRATEHADAQHNKAPYWLGCLFETGYGADIFKDEGYAAELFTVAAELGHPDAGYRMGLAYEKGELTCPKDPSLSIHFYHTAANLDESIASADAMMGLCAWFLCGAEPILEKSEEDAFKWAEKAANKGSVKGMYALGFFLETGSGCRRDILEANKWYVAAADLGDTRATQRLAIINATIEHGDGSRPMEVAPPRDGKMKKAGAKDDKECVVM